MGITVGVSKRGTIVELNVVPLIDILLVLLVIFMILTPLKSQGLTAQIPQPSEDGAAAPEPETVVVEVLSDGSLRINQHPVEWELLGEQLSQIFRQRPGGVAFVRGDRPVEFSRVARVIDIMHDSGVGAVGLLTPELESAH